MSTDTDRRGSVEVALQRAVQLLPLNPRLASEQAREILKVAPETAAATLLIGTALRRSGELDESIATIAAITERHPRWPLARLEHALSLGAAGRHSEATAEARLALELRPRWADAWRTLADELTAEGDLKTADHAYAQAVRYSTTDQDLLVAAEALCNNDLPKAEAKLREILKRRSTDVAALRMLAEVAARLQRYSDAELLLRRCLELAPSYAPARHNLALVLHRRNQPLPALQELEILLAADSSNPGYLNLKAALLARIGAYDDCLQVYESVLGSYPNQPKVWMSYGHALKTASKTSASIAAYRRSIEQLPTLGEAYWSLANLKTFRFTRREIHAMRAQLERADLSEEDRFHLHFSLGKALEDERQYAESFVHYQSGNELRRQRISYDPEENTRGVQNAMRVLTAEFFAERRGWGHTAADPIFIVGLPRSGSTLIEQILASHSAVEGTMELPEIAAMSRRARERVAARADGNAHSEYSAALALLSKEECSELGQAYLDAVRVHRREGRIHFIDKMPNNFVHIGLIHLMLPRARIVDARRHPMACCFSGFKQHFARGQHFSYRLEDIGQYYCDYVEVMEHYDRVLSGRVHRVIYERLVENTEDEIRRLLDYCGLPFESDCLRFFENERPVVTASSEQVRQPINRDGIDQWRQYEPWLQSLKEKLGEVLTKYPVR